jgi:glycerol uptake facilitator-like aquaporin
MKKLGAEFVGTFFVTLVATSVDVLYYTGTGHVDYVSRWLVRGFITTAMIYGMMVILTTSKEAAVGKQAALAVGLTVAACGFFAGPISGASMNPARSRKR